MNYIQKQILKNIAKCKNPKCPNTFCASSRYVLAHYHKCKDQTCEVCGPVRFKIQQDLAKSNGDASQGSNVLQNGVHGLFSDEPRDGKRQKVVD